MSLYQTSKSGGRLERGNSPRFTEVRIINASNLDVKFLALSKCDGQKVALKKIQLVNMLDAKSRADCINEIDLLKQLSHRERF